MKNMTKALLCMLLSISLLLGLAACADDKGSSSSGLEGTYILSGITYSDGASISGDDLKTEVEEAWGMSLSDTYLELHADGTGTLCVYGLPQEIAFEDGKFWYTEFLDLAIEPEDVVEFDEEGFPIENTATEETTEPTVPEDIKLPFTVSGKTITLDPDGFGETLTFTKQ